jgi:predicted naringenin-chalcone synthase
MSGKHEGSQEMRIAGVASAFPKNYYPQEVIREALKGRWQNKLEKQQLRRLEEFMGPRCPEPGSLSILAAMGPGFCSEFVLLRW